MDPQRNKQWTKSFNQMDHIHRPAVLPDQPALSELARAQTRKNMNTETDYELGLRK